MNKPLNKELREEMRALRDVCRDRTPYTGQMIEWAMEAEAFWREAVKNANINATMDDATLTRSCPFCDADELKPDAGIPHKSDCPWLLAQEPQ